MRDLKKYSSYKILKEIKENDIESRKEWMLYLFLKAGQFNSNNKSYQFWRQGNHPIELDFHGNMFEQKLNYLHENPVEVGLVKRASLRNKDFTKRVQNKNKLNFGSCLWYQDLCWRIKN